MNVGTAIALIIFFLLIDVLAVIAMVSMLISIRKDGDERRKMIVQKSCANTLIFALIYLLLTSILKVLAVFMLDDDFDINPISTMAIISVIYLLQVRHYKKKFGDKD